MKTRYKGILLTAVGIDPNDCIYPLAMGVVEVEYTSSWEWFLTTLRDDLNITNTSHFTIMSDKQKVLVIFCQIYELISITSYYLYFVDALTIFQFCRASLRQCTLCSLSLNTDSV